ncbi:antibiotic biosynthesis monooxygenase [Bradyrhizobium sp. CB1650]|uniref:antibiotic biosynthesis monooxygenase family protein n=1 Tax=Bradyrhizobium sp. CB1650 TaxID=3039153 RepID=UPI002434AA0E|nr:antibiotic biosynthesis monooxygenase [Bradyrhizobium sp. CB1650]WGD52116.1 antibiotic biosynthesis monooxygenase [Bradyrhizobium sp. CB1650]
MIARIWRATATRDKALTYQHHFATRVVPHLRAIDGFSGASLLRREIAGGSELLALTLWRSLDSIRAFAGPDPDKAIVDSDAQAMLTTFDATAGNYEIVVDIREDA